MPPNRVHFRFGLSFGSDPSPPSSRKTAVSAYGSITLHRYSRRDFNPLDTCAAGRTETRLRGLWRRIVLVMLLGALFPFGLFGFGSVVVTLARDVIHNGLNVLILNAERAVCALPAKCNGRSNHVSHEM